jgi:hypothetical protein
LSATRKNSPGDILFPSVLMKVISNMDHREMDLLRELRAKSTRHEQDFLTKQIQGMIGTTSPTGLGFTSGKASDDC